MRRSGIWQIVSGSIRTAGDEAEPAGRSQHRHRRRRALHRALKTCEAGGLSEVILYFNFGLLNHRDTLRAMERFARDVMPHFAEKTEPAATTPSTPSSAR